MPSVPAGASLPGQTGLPNQSPGRNESPSGLGRYRPSGPPVPQPQPAPRPRRSPAKAGKSPHRVPIGLPTVPGTRTGGLPKAQTEGFSAPTTSLTSDPRHGAVAADAAVVLVAPASGPVALRWQPRANRSATGNRGPTPALVPRPPTGVTTNSGARAGPERKTEAVQKEPTTPPPEWLPGKQHLYRGAMA